MEKRRMFLLVAAGLLIGLATMAPARAAADKGAKPNTESGGKAEAKENAVEKKAEAKERATEKKAESRAKQKDAKSGQSSKVASTGGASAGLDPKRSGKDLISDGPERVSASKVKASATAASTEGSNVQAGATVEVLPPEPAYTVGGARALGRDHVKNHATNNGDKAGGGGGNGLAGEIVDLVTDAPQTVSFPLLLALCGLLFLMLQGRMDRSDPKIAQAAKKRSFITFE